MTEGMRMVLIRWESIQHLFRIGALMPEDVVNGDVSVEAMVSRNHLLRVDARRGGFIIKQPRDGAQDGVTMWTEATFFWLSANDPAFAPLERWLPRFVHYDEPQRILTIEHVAPATSLTQNLLGAGIPPVLATEIGRALGTLHGQVSRATAGAPSRGLFGALVPWALTLGSAENRYMPVNAASSAVLSLLAGRPDVLLALARLRAGWRRDAIIHGDVKGPNILIVGDGTIRLIDWELTGMGDERWDIAGLVHTLLIPNPAASPEPLAVAQGRARPLIEAFRTGCREVTHAGFDQGMHATILAMAGARILQTCLESTHHGSLSPCVHAMFEMATELLVLPELASARWAS